MPVQYRTLSSSRFFSTVNLHLLPVHCIVTWSLLTRTDANWICWLTADALVPKHKHNFETYSLSQTAATPYTGCTELVHCLQKVHCRLRLLMRQPWQNNCRHSRRLMMTPYTRNATDEISKKLPNQNWHSNETLKALFVRVRNSKLSRNAYLIRICPEDGRGRYVLFFTITNEIMTTSTTNNCVNKTFHPDHDTAVFSRLHAVYTQHTAALAAALMPKHSLCCNHTVALIHHPSPSSCTLYLRVTCKGR